MTWNEEMLEALLTDIEIVAARHPWNPDMYEYRYNLPSPCFPWPPTVLRDRLKACRVEQDEISELVGALEAFIRVAGDEHMGSWQPFRHEVRHAQRVLKRVLQNELRKGAIDYITNS